MGKKEVFEALTVVSTLLLIIALVIISGCAKQNAMEEKIVTPEELWKNRDFYVGKEAVVHGAIESIRPICTGVECYEANPCCQDCGSSLYLIVSKQIELPFYGEFNGKEVLCRGTNCNLICYPFQSGKNYTIKVLLKKTEVFYYLELLEMLRRE